MGRRRIRRTRFALLVIFVLLAFYLGVRPHERVLYLSTTTSTYDSGLLDYILPSFQNEYGVDVRVLPQGTGQAIRNGEAGDVDVVLVHAPELEREFVDSGHGVMRRCVMYNDFVILGSHSDPAGVAGAMSAADAFRKISDSRSLFVSRADDSGTYKKEMDIWKAGGTEPEVSWYLETGAGMGDALRIANDESAYILADRGTYLAMKEGLGLGVLFQGDELLHNPYGVIAVNPAMHPSVNHEDASLFIKWLISNSTQDMIGNFTKNGEQLFVPLYGRCAG